MRFGVRLPVAGPLAEPAAIKEVAQASEGLGFDSVWVHDFIVWTTHLDRVHISCGSREAVEDAGEYPPNFFESLTTLSYVAGATSRVRLGIAVLCLPFRSPVVTAKQVATLDVLSGGRLILGVGAGAVKSTGNKDFEVLGVPRKDKYRITADYLRAMTAIWAQDEPSYQGEHVSFPATEIYPKPVQRPHPPIWLGGAGPSAIDLAGQFGDGWIPGRIPPEGYPERVAAIRERAAEAGRADAAFTVASEIVGCVATTQEEAVAKSARTVGTLSGEAGFAALEVQDSFATHGLIGDPQTIRRRVEQFADAGVEEMEVKFVYRDVPDLLGQLQLFADEVMDAPAGGRS